MLYYVTCAKCFSCIVLLLYRAAQTVITVSKEVVVTAMPLIAATGVGRGRCEEFSGASVTDEFQ